MPVIKDIWVGDVGTIFRAIVTDGDAIVDLQAVLTKQICFKKPDGTIEKHDATFTTDGSDGKIQYAVVSGDLDDAGRWEFWAEVTYAGGQRRTSYEEFTVWE
jgi:hypothetical protein